MERCAQVKRGILLLGSVQSKPSFNHGSELRSFDSKKSYGLHAELRRIHTCTHTWLRPYCEPTVRQPRRAALIHSYRTMLLPCRLLACNPVEQSPSWSPRGRQKNPKCNFAPAEDLFLTDEHSGHKPSWNSAWQPKQAEYAAAGLDGPYGAQKPPYFNSHIQDYTPTVLWHWGITFKAVHGHTVETRQQQNPMRVNETRSPCHSNGHETVSPQSNHGSSRVANVRISPYSPPPTTTTFELPHTLSTSKPFNKLGAQQFASSSLARAYDENCGTTLHVSQTKSVTARKAFVFRVTVVRTSYHGWSWQSSFHSCLYFNRS
jgi:hypothetical protein